ncbi:MAG: META domain-containing protein, partial [Gemmatimonadota bacterium]|nr:META domain-containing protein [Gemmatimonadota bacterium]
VLDGDSGATTMWQVVTLAGVPVAVPDSIAPTLKLPAATGKAGGMSGCNRWFAGVIRSGEALSFAPVGATKMACAGPAMDVEQRWFAALERVRRISERDGNLVLVDSAGSELATLRRH